MAQLKSKPLSPLQQKIIDAVLKPITRADIQLFRATGGRLSLLGLGAGNVPVLLLTTVGRKTGLPRTVTLLYLKDGDRYIIVASKGGMPKHPIWYLNLQANPQVEIEVGKQKFRCKARTASAEEHRQLWPKLVKLYKGYQTYQNRTERDIPVVILEP